MSNKSSLAYGSKVSEVELYYFASSAVLPSANSVPLGTSYIFLSQIDAWPEANTPVPQLDQKSIKQSYKNMFVAKLAQPTDFSPVVKRIDWTENTQYDYYTDEEDMFVMDENNLPVKNF